MTRDELIKKKRVMLEQAGAANISVYIDKLCSNKTNNGVFDDLLFESRTALMFLIYGFSVDMQESPDLRIEFVGNQFYAEVKHFRLKEQDRLDQANMEAAQDKLVTYGDTVQLEDDPPWIQVIKVAKRKIKQYRENAPNILVIGSSSPHCIDDSIMPTAINIIAEEIAGGRCPDLDKLNGILLISSDYNIGQRRNVYFFQTHTARV